MNCLECESRQSSDFSHALRVLEDEKKQLVVTKDDDRERAKITAEGIARHEEASH